MRIKQCKMLNFYQEKTFKEFFRKYSLNRYTFLTKPAIFFSLWGFGFLKNHKSLAVVIWRGSDIVKMEGKLKTIKKMKNVYHIAISSYIARDLDKYGIKYKFIPVVGVGLKYFKPVPMGNEIFVYMPETDSKKYTERYGMKIVKKIQKKCRYKINIVKRHQYSRKKMFKIYKKCFCGLRMTMHDGLPSQVIEMGVMGIRSFYNGDIPGSISWSEPNIDKIIEDIEVEAQKIGTIDHEYSQQINNFINIGDKWLDTKFWEK